MSRLKQKYESDVKPALTKQYQYKSSMQTPKVEKVVISMCAGQDAVKNPKVVNLVVDELAAITGQKPKSARARKAISNFKLRENMALGGSVTLRKDRMWAFLDRLFSVALPRVRDFRGISAKGFDGRGNFNMGLKEQIVFPEINYDKVDKVRGMNITICTSAKTDAEGKALLEQLGLPFRK
ncbi:MAG: 50S ribosomal protein L5 [Bdellovibrionales bacterium]|nr:50S ribosomal protein L5 [Bdellovibrionales bacterium]